VKKVIKVICSLLIVAMPLQVSAGDCSEDKGVLNDSLMFGSTEQVKRVQNSVRDGCKFMSVKYSPIVGITQFLLLDMEEKKLLRIKQSAAGTSWIGWNNFTKDQLLKDDPSDGFDLPNYRSGIDEPVPSSYISNKMIEAIN
jgi:hypothetical protein